MKIAKYPESQKLTAKYRDMSVLLLGSDSAETIFVVVGKTEKKNQGKTQTSQAYLKLVHVP